ESRPWWRVRLQALGLTIGLSAFMVLAFVLAIFGGRFAALVAQVLGPGGGIALLVLEWMVVVTVTTLVAGVIYYACPDVQQRWAWVTPGSMLFTLGFGGASAGFSYYVGRFGSYDRTCCSLG